jgi:hypothetical protein
MYTSARNTHTLDIAVRLGLSQELQMVAWDKLFLVHVTLF